MIPSGAIDNVPLSNVYPTSRQQSLGVTSTVFGGIQDVMNTETNGAPSSPAAPATNGMGLVGAGLTMVALLLLLMFAAKRLGEEGDFKNVKVSFYNVLLISLAAVTGIPLLKMAFSRVPVPGVSAWIASV